jgi:hypothetical protein
MWQPLGSILRCIAHSIAFSEMSKYLDYAALIDGHACNRS